MKFYKREAAAPVKVFSSPLEIMQSPWKKGKNFCHADVAIDIGDMGPASPAVSVYLLLSFFGSPRLLAFFLLPCPAAAFGQVYYDGWQRQFLKLFAMKYAESS